MEGEGEGEDKTRPEAILQVDNLRQSRNRNNIIECSRNIAVIWKKMGRCVFYVKNMCMFVRKK